MRFSYQPVIALNKRDNSLAMQMVKVEVTSREKPQLLDNY